MNLILFNNFYLGYEINATIDKHLIFNNSTATLLINVIIYKYKLAANTISLLSNLIASENLFSNSVFPMFFAACTICLKSSSKRRIDRIMLPEIE